MFKTKVFAVVLLFVVTCNTSLALMSVGVVSRDRAEALGIEVRAKPSGSQHAWIELEFRPEEELAPFHHVSLEIRDSDQLRLGWTPLKDRRTRRGCVTVRVMGSRQFLDQVTLRIVYGELGGLALDVRIRDFVDWEHVAHPKAAERSEGGDQPATVVEPTGDGDSVSPPAPRGCGSHGI